MIRRQNCHARVPWNPCREPVRHALRHSRQLREGDPLHRLLALDLKGNVLGKLLGRFLNSLVKGGHGPEEILQGRAGEANPAASSTPIELNSVRQNGVWFAT